MSVRLCSVLKRGVFGGPDAHTHTEGGGVLCCLCNAGVFVHVLLMGVWLWAGLVVHVSREVAGRGEGCQCLSVLRHTLPVWLPAVGGDGMAALLLHSVSTAVHRFPHRCCLWRRTEGKQGPDDDVTAMTDDEHPLYRWHELEGQGREKKGHKSEGGRQVKVDTDVGRLDWGRESVCVCERETLIDRAALEELNTEQFVAGVPPKALQCESTAQACLLARLIQ